MESLDKLRLKKQRLIFEYPILLRELSIDYTKLR